MPYQNFGKLLSQNHRITCDLKSDPSQNFAKAWSQNHKITLWSQSKNLLLKLWNSKSHDHKITGSHAILRVMPFQNFGKLWSQNHRITCDLKSDALSEFWKGMITKSQDHIVITIKKPTVKTLKLNKLWSQNHGITCDLKSDALSEFLKGVITKSQDHLWFKKRCPLRILERHNQKITRSHCDHNKKTYC